jgi:hypothetical protein
MKKILYIAAMALMCASCFRVNSNYHTGKKAIKGEGAVITKSFDLKDFDSITINGHADVTFTQSPEFEVTLSTQENVFEYMDYRVEGNTLILETKDKRSVRAESYDVTIKAPALKRLVVNGASDFNIPAGLVSEDDLDVNVNGAGDLDFKQIRCGKLNIVSNGASDIDATSISATGLSITVNGAGDVIVSGDVSGDASLEVNGAGDIDARNLTVSGELKKRAAGVARIKN